VTFTTTSAQAAGQAHGDLMRRDGVLHQRLRQADCRGRKAAGDSARTNHQDGNVSLMTARCVGACSRAPVALCDGEVAGEMTSEQVLEQLERWTVE